VCGCAGCLFFFTFFQNRLILLHIVFGEAYFLYEYPKPLIMPDNKNIRDQNDRSKVAGDEQWEISYMIEKTGASREEIEKAIAAVGNNREKVEEYLKRRSS